MSLTNATLLAYLQQHVSIFPTTLSVGQALPILNDRTGTVTGAATLVGAVPNDPMNSADFVALFNGTESATFTPQLSAQIGIYAPGGGQVDIGDATVQAWINAAFASFPNTKSTLAAQFTRQGSAAERLGGTGTIITSDQLTALNYFTG